MADKDQEPGKMDDREASKQQVTSLFYLNCMPMHEVLEIMRGSNFMTFLCFRKQLSVGNKICSDSS